MKVTVLQANEKHEIKAVSNENVYHALLRHSLPLESYCGGAGTCGKCKLRLKSGSTPLTEGEASLLTEEELRAGIRLACHLLPEDGMVVELLANGELSVVTTGLQRSIADCPLVKRKTITLPVPDLDDQRDLATRICEQTGLKTILPSCFPELAKLQPGSEATLTAAEDTVIQIVRGRRSDNYGIAFDIGTTTIAAYLVDLRTGKEKAVAAGANPQRRHGADILTRINYTHTTPGGVTELQRLLIDGLNTLIEDLTLQVGCVKEDITLVIAAANTVMLHTLMGVSALSIANAPFTPVFLEQIRLDARELGLHISPHGLIILLPGVSGYVGADIVADLLVCDIQDVPDWHALLIDIGTNGEIVLGNSLQAVACSTAAGPAFEGANIHHGRAGLPGAIASFSLKDKTRSYDVIGEGQPNGICGSGLIDVTAELLKHGFITNMGAFAPPTELELWQCQMMTTYRNQPAFVVVPGSGERTILLTQRDIREVQLAKAAIAAGIKILMQSAHITYPKINRVYLAGGFGSFIDIENACRLGLLPAELKEKVVKIGNGAGLGAKQVLANGAELERTQELVKKISYLELSARKEFQALFVDEMFFPEPGGNRNN